MHAGNPKVDWLRIALGVEAEIFCAIRSSFESLPSSKGRLFFRANADTAAPFMA